MQHLNDLVYFIIFIAGNAPKTFLISNSSDYFFPSIQVESSDPEKMDQVTEIYIKSKQFESGYLTNVITIILLTITIIIIIIPTFSRLAT